MTTAPSITIDLGCTTCVEFADLAPRVTGPRALFMSGPVRQLDKDCARRFDVVVVPYPLDKARWELEAEILKHQDAMARSQPLADKMKALLEAGDATDDVLVIAGLVRQAKNLGGNVFYGLR